MKFNVYSVRDEVSRIFKFDFKRPAYFVNAQPSHGEAIRYFGDGVAQKETEMHNHPSDFFLFYTAVYDNETATYENLPIPLRIAAALDFVQPVGGE